MKTPHYRIECIESEGGFPLVYKVMRLDRKQWVHIDTAVEFAAAERMLRAHLPTSKSRVVAEYGEDGHMVSWGPGYSNTSESAS